jgi:hypothetical protein
VVRLQQQESPANPASLGQPVTGRAQEDFRAPRMQRCRLLFGPTEAAASRIVTFGIRTSRP